ncbi:MAG: acyltransferase family protein [Anaerolineae bacterium]|jgi:CubicO group peptidase (beta-lactamase class C family)/peptidoglycan/LPS O-acetylase OafA/YrhL
MHDTGESPEATGKRVSARLHYLDWLRVLAILMVFLFHAVHPFDYDDWQVKNIEQSEIITIILLLLGIWGMPFFFMVAGAASWFALQKRSPSKYLRERLNRLLIPFVVGTILFSPIEMTIEWANKVQRGVVTSSLREFVLKPIVHQDPLWWLTPRWFGYGFHLWFLGFLFAFALVTLPLFLWLKQGAGQRLISWMAGLSAHRGGILLLMVPPALVSSLLGPLFPEEHDWADFIFRMFFFILGYVLFADRRFISAIRRDWWLLLAVPTTVVLSLVAMYLSGLPVVEWGDTPGIPQFYVLHLLASAIALCYSLAMLFVGMQFLDFSNQWLRYGQEAALPFFILHQPAIIVIAFFVVQWNAGIWIKLPTVVLSSLLASVGLYELIIRRIRPLRLLFGMKAEAASSDPMPVLGQRKEAPMRARTIAFGLTAVAILAVFTIVLVPRLLGPGQVPSQTYWPTESWRTSTPEEQGLGSGKLAEGLRGLQEQGSKIDSLLIIRNGDVVLDATFYPYDSTIPHKLASVTKSVMTTLIGIAADQGSIQLDQPMMSFFSDRAIDNLDPIKEQVTVRHLVSMRNGFQSGCMSRDEETLNAMRANGDWVQAALDRRMVREPGTSFCYDSPGMHLLSAILQEATGMTALDFARVNLFEPLGIREVFWQSDPRGYTRGWGDLYLKPRDAAKIGYLWLNNGVWEDEQIVSAAWVSDSVKPLSHAPNDDYGYGWWVSEDSYYASGRGGQNIRVYPSFDAIVVTTANGFDYDQIGPMLTAAFIDPEKPLPANPNGVAELEATLTKLAQAPEPWPVGPLPDTARAISGKTYLFGPNAVDLASMRPAFMDTDEATLTMRLEGADVVWPIGLDGRYRLSPVGQGLRGYWADPQTFVIQVFEDGLSTIRLHFEADRVEIASPERGFAFEGQTENP